MVRHLLVVPLVAAGLAAEICWELVGREQQADRTGVAGPVVG